MMFGFFDVSMIPKTNYVQPWGHQDTPHNSRTIPSRLWTNIIVWEIQQNSKSMFEEMGRWGPTNPEDPFNKFSKTLCMGSVSPGKYELEILGNLEHGIKICKK